MTKSNWVLTTCQIVNQGFHVHYFTVYSFKWINKTTTHTFPKGQAPHPLSPWHLDVFRSSLNFSSNLGEAFQLFSQACSLQCLLLNGDAPGILKVRLPYRLTSPIQWVSLSSLVLLPKPLAETYPVLLTNLAPTRFQMPSPPGGSAPNPRWTT